MALWSSPFSFLYFFPRDECSGYILFYFILVLVLMWCRGDLSSSSLQLFYYRVSYSLIGLVAATSLRAGVGIRGKGRLGCLARPDPRHSGDDEVNDLRWTPVPATAFLLAKPAREEALLVSQVHIGAGSMPLPLAAVPPSIPLGDPSSGPGFLKSGPAPTDRANQLKHPHRSASPARSC